MIISELNKELNVSSFFLFWPVDLFMARYLYSRHRLHKTYE